MFVNNCQVITCNSGDHIPNVLQYVLHKKVVMTLSTAYMHKNSKRNVVRIVLLRLIID